MLVARKSPYFLFWRGKQLDKPKSISVYNSINIHSFIASWCFPTVTALVPTDLAGFPCVPSVQSTSLGFCKGFREHLHIWEYGLSILFSTVNLFPITDGPCGYVRAEEDEEGGLSLPWRAACWWPQLSAELPCEACHSGSPGLWCHGGTGGTAQWSCRRREAALKVMCRCIQNQVQTVLESGWKRMTRETQGENIHQLLLEGARHQLPVLRFPFQDQKNPGQPKVTWPNRYCHLSTSQHETLSAPNNPLLQHLFPD